jgi:hypothetical protein
MVLPGITTDPFECYWCGKSSEQMLGAQAYSAWRVLACSDVRVSYTKYGNRGERRERVRSNECDKLLGMLTKHPVFGSYVQ